MVTTRCPRCGVMNLDKFVTYPYCAGCGTRLPAPAKPPFWKRPVRPLVWPSLLCAGALGLFACVALLNAGESDEGQLLIYGRAPLTASIGQMLPIRLFAQSVGIDDLPSQNDLTNVTLRLSMKAQESFDILALQPPPDVQFSSGSGRYYAYEKLPRFKPVILLVRPRRSGLLHLVVLVSANGQSSADFRAKIHVLSLRETEAAAKRATLPIPQPSATS